MRGSMEGPTETSTDGHQSWFGSTFILHVGLWRVHPAPVLIPRLCLARAELVAGASSPFLWASVMSAARGRNVR
jgi:hypothetical protein